MVRGIAVVTKFLGPTNSKGARIKATCFRGSIIVSYGYDSVATAHTNAVKTLCAKFWPEGNQAILASAEYVDGCGYVAIVDFPEA